jgi:GNAT superfamily N-acetyltransferase
MSDPAFTLSGLGRARALLSDFRCMARKLGFWRTVHKLAVSMLRRIVAVVSPRDAELVLVKDLTKAAYTAGDGRDLGTSGREQRWRIEPLQENHCAALLRMHEDACSLRQGRRVLSNVRSGYRGFVVNLDGEAIGYFWWIDKRIAPQHPHLVRYEIDLGSDEAYCFQYFIAPDYRGEGLANDVLASIEAELHQLGYKRLWGYVESVNLPARWLYSVTGWDTVRAIQRR